MAAPALHGTAFGRGAVSAIALALGQLVLEPSAFARETTTMGAVQVSASLRTPAPTCPSERELLASVRRALRNEPNEKAPLAVEIVVEIVGDEAVGTVRTLPREAGAAYGERTTRAPSCANLSEVLVLVVAQTLDPLAGVSARPSETPKAAKGREVVAPSDRRPPMTLALPAPRGIFGATSGLTLASGILPTLALGADFGVWAGVARPDHAATRLRGRLELHATLFVPDDRAVRPGVVHFRAASGSLAICPIALGREALVFFPCAAPGVLAVEAGAEGFEKNASSGSVVPFVALTAIARLRLTSSLAVRLSFAGALHLRRAEWEVAPVGLVHRVAPLATSVSLSFESLGP